MWVPILVKPQTAELLEHPPLRPSSPLPTKGKIVKWELAPAQSRAHLFPLVRRHLLHGQSLAVLNLAPHLVGNGQECVQKVFTHIWVHT